MQQLPVLPSLWWGLAAVLPLALAWRRPLWLVVAFFVLGVVWATFRAGLILDDNLASALEGQDLTLVGHVADIPEEAEYGFRFRFDIDEARNGDDIVRVPSRVLLNSSLEGFTPRAGERWRLCARLSRPHGYQNPGGFDYEGHLFRNRIRARGYVRADYAPQRVESNSFAYVIDRFRQQLGERIVALVPQSPMTGFVVALANGDERRVNDAQWRVLRATGTVHLVAISGLHISLIGGIAFFLGRFLWALPGVTVQRCAAPVVGAMAALIAATGYAALAGFVVPTQRALIMLTVAMAGILLRRRFLPSQLLAAAMMAVLIYDPLSAIAPGFWLSFGAVAILLFVASAEDQSWWRRFGYLQLAVALGMLPLLLALFGQISLISPLANMIAIPAFDMVAVPLTLAGIASLAVSSDMAAVFFKLAAWVLEQLWPLLEWLGDLPHARWTQHAPPAWALACAVVGVAVLLAPRGWPARWVGVLWLAPLFCIPPPVPTMGQVWFTLLDVGQGLSIVVRTAQHVLVFDTGPRLSDSFNTGDVVVVPYLRTNGLSRVDMLVISHADNDHRGGAESVLREMTVNRVLSSEQGLAFASEPCRRGMRWQWDGVEFEMLHPAPEEHSKRNNLSCVLMVRSRYGNILLPADIEKPAERELLARFEMELKADILVAPHHGSKTSSHPQFIAAVNPTYVLFPVGYRNRFHHPHPSVVERYEGAGARRLDSASAGAIELHLDEQGIHAAAYRETHRRYWFAQ